MITVSFSTASTLRAEPTAFSGTENDDWEASTVGAEGGSLSPIVGVLASISLTWSRSSSGISPGSVVKWMVP